MRLCHLRHLFRAPFRDDLSTRRATFRTEVDDPIGGFDHIQVVFHDHQRVSGIHQFVQHGEQLFDVVEMQARRRFIENVELVVRRGIFEFSGDF